MKLRSGRIISEPKPSVVMKPDVIMIDLTIDEIPKSADPNAPYTFKNPRPQEFSLPYPLVKYITMKATSFKAWRKLISTCKYFYARNPVIPIRDCQKSKYNDYEWSLSWTFGKYKLIDLRNISCKFWLHGHLYSDETTSHSFLAPKVFRYDPNSLTLHSQIILYDEYQRLTSGKMIEYLYFCDVNVIYPDGSPVALDKLLKNLSNAKKITL
uniref:Uncharacterized protein n=1 Tax=Panagrolaimus sp. ES5 TaxID=591445 RepID=A0AC34GVV4_9BILA